ncbi:MAG: dihydrodipicolinate synthase family protein [Spirochaetaceae bacterium]|nr:dihydrodipicolinate synthase family protein [Spirochaetaceae bacterium]
MIDVHEAKDLFRGPMVSVATPFTAQFDLDLDALRDNIVFMLDRGMATGKGVLLVAAAGGEFPMLSMEERKEVIRASVEAAAGRIPVAASIQFDGTREIIELAHYARRVGASLGQLSSPSYYPPPAQDIFDLFEAVSEETELPIMIYNNWWTTPNMNVDTVDRLARLPGVVALKWSSSSMGEYTAGLHRFADRLAIIDNLGMAVWAHLLGAVGFITHQSNFWPEYPLSLWELLERKDYDAAVAELARFSWRWDEWTHKVCEETEGEGPFIKAAMEEVGLAAGPPRPPARPVSAHLRQELRGLFADSGVPKANGVSGLRRPKEQAEVPG